MSSVAIGYSPATADSQGAPLPTVVTAFGAKGDGTTDDTTAIQAALNDSHAVDFPDGKTFLISSSLTPQSNSVLRFHGNVTLKAKVQGWADRGMIEIDGVSNVRIEGGTLDGQKSSNPTGRVIGIQVLNDASNVTIVGVRAINMPGQDATGINGGDGFYIGGTTGTPDTVTLTDCIADGNVRQGLTIAAGTHIRVYGGAFRNTTGSAPGCGLDIEPNSATDVVQDVQFFGTAFTGNGGHGVDILFSNATGTVQRGIRFMGCLMSGNATDGLNVEAVRDLEVDGCDISANTANGIEIGSAASTNIAITGGRVSLNGLQGISASTDTDVTTSGLQIRGVRIQDNSQTTSGASHGIKLLATATGSSIDGVVIDGCTIGNLDGTTQDFGVSISAGVKHLQLTNNAIIGNTGGPAALGDDAATRVSSGNYGVNDAVSYASTAPTTGSWSQGDIVWNTSPTASGNIGWVCVTTGTPGTWKTFGTIAA